MLLSSRQDKGKEGTKTPEIPAHTNSSSSSTREDKPAAPPISDTSSSTKTTTYQQHHRQHQHQHHQQQQQPPTTNTGTREETLETESQPDQLTDQDVVAVVLVGFGVVVGVALVGDAVLRLRLAAILCRVPPPLLAAPAPAVLTLLYH